MLPKWRLCIYLGSLFWFDLFCGFFSSFPCQLGKPNCLILCFLVLLRELLHWEQERNDTDPNPPHFPPFGDLVTFGTLMASAARCDQAPLTPFLQRRRVQGLDHPWIELPSPCPIPFQAREPVWLRESAYSGSTPSQGVVFWGSPGTFLTAD